MCFFFYIVRVKFFLLQEKVVEIIAKKWDIQLVDNG